jgi:corrinoid protein of di/trimethylamine methyltransferase
LQTWGCLFDISDKGGEMTDTKDKILDKLMAGIIQGERNLACEAAEESLAAGLDPLDTIQRGSAAAMELVGRRFSSFEIFLPELILAAEAANGAMDILLPEIAANRRQQAQAGQVVIGTVAGDLHDIGKSLVSAVLSAAGFRVYDLGVDVPAKRFVDAAMEMGADIIGLSSLLTTSMQFQKDVIDYAIDMGIRDRCFIIVGGGPVTPDWMLEVGADGYGRRASDAAELCRLIMHSDQRPPLSSPIAIDGSYE